MMRLPQESARYDGKKVYYDTLRQGRVILACELEEPLAQARDRPTPSREGAASFTDESVPFGNRACEGSESFFLASSERGRDIVQTILQCLRKLLSSRAAGTHHKV